MRDFLLEFERRSGEVRRYIAALTVAERAIFSRGKKSHVEDLKVFRAGAILVIYNAIEASARLGIQAIYDAIAATGTTFDDLNDSLKVKILSDFNANAGRKNYDQIQSVAIDLISHSFDAQKLFAGNVDARKIKEISEKYGFSTDSEHSVTQHGSDLLTIKSKRQDLAHGNLSFSEVGREYSTADIRRMSRYSMAYMHSILRHIDDYLDKELYKKADLPKRPTPPSTETDSGHGLLSRARSLLPAWVARRFQ